MVRVPVFTLFCNLIASMYLSETKLPRDLLAKKPTFKKFPLIHMFLDQTKKVNFIESQKVPGLLVPSKGYFHVQVQHNLHNLNLVINTSGQGIFEKKIDKILRDLKA